MVLLCVRELYPARASRRQIWSCFLSHRGTCVMIASGSQSLCTLHALWWQICQYFQFNRDPPVIAWFGYGSVHTVDCDLFEWKMWYFLLLTGVRVSWLQADFHCLVQGLRELPFQTMCRSRFVWLCMMRVRTCTTLFAMMPESEHKISKKCVGSCVRTSASTSDPVCVCLVVFNACTWKSTWLHVLVYRQHARAEIMRPHALPILI